VGASLIGLLPPGILYRRVQEGKDLDSANDFVRYVFWSGLIDLFKANANPFPLPIDGALTEWKVKELLHNVQERFRTGDQRPRMEMTELEAINRKLDLIAGHVSKLNIMPEQPFRIIDGGLI
jgi:hypothetical protein